MFYPPMMTVFTDFRTEASVAIINLALCSGVVSASTVGWEAGENTTSRNVIEFYNPTVENEFFLNLKPGVKVNEIPVQLALNQPKSVKLNRYVLTLLDTFHIKGLVLSERHYLADARADIAPWDLTLGWSRMSDPAVLKNIEIYQNNRFYYWHVNEFPISRKELEATSTNIHMIPQNKAVLDNMKLIRKGQMVDMSGYLVNARAPDGFVWKTSRSRLDSGDGACEILLVTKVSNKPVD